MIIKDYIPDAACKDYVKCYRIVHFRFDQIDKIPCKNYPPKPEQVLHFVSKKGFSIENAEGANLPQPEIFFLGQQRYLIKQIMNAREYVNFQIVFQPTAVFRLTGIPGSELTGRAIDATEIFHHRILEVQDQLQNALSYPEMLEIGVRYVKSLIHFSRKEFHILDEVAASIGKSGINLSLDRLASESCLCVKQFHRKFKERTGVNPKDYTRVVRFNKAYNLKNKFPSMDWLSIALEAGFYDYKHLIKNYKEFTGVSPVQFHLIEAQGPDRLLGLAQLVYNTRA